MSVFHRYLGAAIVMLFLTIFLWGLFLLALRRDEAPTSLWAV